MPWRHQAITWTNVDLSSTWSSGIHSRVMFTWIIHILILRLCLKLTHLKSQPHLPGDNELNLKWKFPSPRWCRSFLCADTWNSYTIEYSKTCANGSHFHTCKVTLDISRSPTKIMIMPSDVYQRALLMIRSQHWFRYWIGAVRQQAITWANVDPDLYCHMASLGHNELISWHNMN